MIYFRDSGNPDILTPPELLVKAASEMDVDFELWCEDQTKVNQPHWAFDNYRIHGAMDYEVSHLFYTQPSWGLFFAERMGQDRIKLLTYAVDEEIYPEVEAEKEYDLGFIGNFGDNDGRGDLFDFLKDKYNCFVSSTVPTRDIAKEYAKCKIILNPIRYEEINIRFFEALACGVQLCSYSPALNLFAEEGKHYMTYRDRKELIEKIDLLLSEPELRKTIATEARKEVLRRHTYKHRVKELLNFI